MHGDNKCGECWGTGYFKGYGAPCTKGKPSDEAKIKAVEQRLAAAVSPVVAPVPLQSSSSAGRRLLIYTNSRGTRFKIRDNQGNPLHVGDRVKGRNTGRVVDVVGENGQRVRVNVGGGVEESWISDDCVLVDSNGVKAGLSSGGAVSPAKTAIIFGRFPYDFGAYGFISDKILPR